LEPTLLYRGEVRAWAKTQVVAFAFAGLKELIIQATLECFDSGTSHSSRWTEAFLGFRRLNLDRVKVTVEVSIIDEDTDDGEASDEEISDEECEEDMDEETEDEMEEANITERRLREVAEGLKKKLLRLE
ncbi:MAG: hypothetical protein M1830_003527, partial [Pleopsidium flavum]